MQVTTDRVAILVDSGGAIFYKLNNGGTESTTGTLTTGTWKQIFLSFATDNISWNWNGFIILWLDDQRIKSGFQSQIMTTAGTDVTRVGGFKGQVAGLQIWSPAEVYAPYYGSLYKMSFIKR